MDFIRGSLSIGILLLLVGCAGAKPYAEIGIGYQLDKHTDYWLQTDRSWQCSDQPEFIGELGLETPKNWAIALEHESWVRCGGPFGDGKPEIDSNRIKITKKFGGY